MRHLSAVLFLCALAVTTAAQKPATHAVTITLDYDAEAKVCAVASVQPTTVEVDLGDKIDWTAKASSDQCANRAVKLANFKLKANGKAKDPVPGCNKQMTTDGPALSCTVNGAAKGETFKYDVEVPEGRGMDPEIRVRS